MGTFFSNLGTQLGGALVNVGTQALGSLASAGIQRLVGSSGGIRASRPPAQQARVARQRSPQSGPIAGIQNVSALPGTACGCDRGGRALVDRRATSQMVAYSPVNPARPSLRLGCR